MVSNRAGNWTVRGLTFLVWAAAAASAAYWGLRLGTSAGPAPVPTPVVRQPPAPDPMAIARLLGHSASAAGPVVAQPSLASRFSLVGVVADRSQQGAALIVVDGRPARPYRVGSQVDEGLVLQSVQPRRAVLGGSVNGPPVLTLELPAQQR